MKSEFTIRKADPSELSFIFSSWLKSYRFGSEFAKQIEDKVFFHRHHAVIERILNAPSTAAFVATPVGDSATILGYLIIQEISPYTILHYVYVKSAFRRLGVTTELVKYWGGDLNRATYTHKTHDAHYLTKLYLGLVYDPYLIG